MKKYIISKLDFLNLERDLYIRFFSEFISKILNFSLIPLISYNTGVITYGNYVQIICIIMGLIPILTIGLNFTIIKKLSGNKTIAENSSGFFSAIILISLISFILFIFFLILQIFFAFQILENFSIVILILAYLFSIELIITETLRSKIKSNEFCILQLTNSFFLILCIVFLGLIYKINIQILLSSLLLIKILVIFIGLNFLFKKKIIEMKMCLKIKKILSFISPGIIFMITGLAEWSLNFSDKLILGSTLNLKLVSIYFTIGLISSGVLSLGSIFWWKLFPVISKYNLENKNNKIFQYIKSSNLKFLEISLPFILFITFFGSEIISFLLNLNNIFVGHIIFFYCSGILFHQLSTGWEFFCYLKKKGIIVFKITIFWGFISLLLYYLLIPKFSINGAVLTFIIIKGASFFSLQKKVKNIGYIETIIETKKVKNLLISFFLSFICFISLKKIILQNTEYSFMIIFSLGMISLFVYFILKKKLNIGKV